MSLPSPSTPPRDVPNAASVVNMADVAARAGVSIATVSRALRDVPGVSASTRRKIRDIAEELAYVVSPEASRLAQRSTGRVAVVVPRTDIWFYAAMLSGLEGVLRRADLDVLVYQVDGVDERRRFFRDLPARRKVDAVVLVALPVLADEEDRLDLLGVQVVVAGGQLGGHAHVRVDDHAVARLATEHLLDLGHRSIAMVRTDDTTGTAWSADVERTRGFRQCLAAAGVALPGEHLLTTTFGPAAGVVAADRLLALPTMPTAVFAYSDEIAVGLVQRLRHHGVDVPGEVSVVGVDDHPMAEVLGITTVRQHVDEQARLAAETVVGLLHGTTRATPALIVEPELVVRSTTAPPRR